MADFPTDSHTSPTLAPRMGAHIASSHIINSMSDDECIARLAEAVGRHDDAKLDELAALIGRLAVCIEV